MAKVLVTESNLEDIGDAIRDRLQVSTTYLPSEMGDAVRSIPVIDIDTTLTRSGYAADAKVVGDRFDDLIDPVLHLSGKAADAKATGEAIADVEKSVEDVTDILSVSLIDGFTGGKYIQTNGDVGTTVAIDSPQTSSNFAYKVVSVSVGDKITLNGTGGNAGRLWAFIDSSNALLSKADANAVASNLVLTAPANAAKLVLNVNLNATIGANYIGTSVDSRIAGNVDATLSVSGKAADARATGEAIADLAANTIQMQNALAAGTDLDNIKSPGVWFCPTNRSYAHYPYSEVYASWLIVVNVANLVQQILIPYFQSDKAPALNMTPLRRNFPGSAWSSWKWNSDPNVITTATSDPLTGAEIDLNSIVGNNFYLLPDAHTYLNKPEGFTIGFIESVLTAGWSIQFLWQFNGRNMWKRRGNASGSSWESWQLIGGENTYITNEYSYPEYNNSYTIQSTPTITTDTNAYLAPSGTADRTADIVTMLNAYGVCRLGKGDYYVKNLQMPDNTELIGAGSATRIILDSGDGYCIKMGSCCEVHDVLITGDTNGITPSGTLGNRHGILWQGNFSEDSTASTISKKGIVSNVWIENFTGGGITCYNTGYGTFYALEVTNVYCSSCGAGINIAYWSEFHKFTNVRTPSCYYGCINNGGNNIFVNCDFSTCKVAVLMDNSSSQSPNNSHGSMVGCVFNHTDGNTGIGIKILNCDNGFVFVGCQIFYSQIYIENSDGVVVSDTNFGNPNCDITISGGGAILFANNMHQAAPVITITNNSNVHFANCYVRSTGAAVSN